MSVHVEECTALCLSCTLAAVPHAATLTRACYSDWPRLLAVSQSSYWTMSILMDGDVHYNWILAVPALLPRKPIDFYTLIHHGATNAVACAAWRSNTYLLSRNNSSRTLEEGSIVGYTAVYFLIHAACLWLVLIIIVWSWLENNPGSYVKNMPKQASLEINLL